MADSETGPEAGPARKDRLAGAIERVRNDQANRDDVVVEMKQAARARLELLAQELRPVFDQLPPGQGQFEFGLSGGETPRLWIDLTTYIRMGREPRSYEFIKDTRNGRVMLGESTEMEEIAGLVSNYIAERVLQRERKIEGEWLDMRAQGPAGRSTAAVSPLRAGFSFGAFLLGLIIGAAAMVAWAWFGQPPSL